MTTQRAIKAQVAEAEAKHPDYSITTYPGQGHLKGLTLFHATHKPTGLQTSRDGPSIGGALWCIAHFDEVKDDPRFWSKETV